MKLVLVRHTAVAKTDGLCYGRTEVALADTFAADADSVRASLPPGPWSLHTSPASRCQRLARHLGNPVAIDPRLQELDFGVWDGQLWDRLPRPELDAWCAAFTTTRPPHGETFTELAARAEHFVADIAQRRRAIVVAITHAGVIRALLAPRRGLAVADAFTIAVPPGSVHVLELTRSASP